MDSRLSSILDLIADTEESARRGDWKKAGEIAATLRRQTPPEDREELGEYLLRLQAALIAAKVSRAHVSASLAKFNAAAARLNAASTFTNARLHITRLRQDFGETADS